MRSPLFFMGIALMSMLLFARCSADAASNSGVVETPVFIEVASGDKLDAPKRFYSAEQQQLVISNKLHAQENGAISLDSKGYASFMESHPLVMVLYYAPWCFWSRATLPEFDAAARMLAHHDPPVIFAKVDCTENGTIADSEGIREYPTIRFFMEGQALAFDDRRYRTNIIHWIDKHLDRNHTLTSVAHMNELLTNKNHGHLVVIAAFPQDQSKTAYVSVARAFSEDVFFGDVTDSAIIDHLKSVHIFPNLAPQSKNNLLIPPFIAVFSPHADDGGVHLYEGNIYDVNIIRTFIRKHRFPIVSVFNSDALSSSFFADPRPKLVLMADTKANAHIIDADEVKNPRGDLISAFKKAAEEFRNELTAVVSGNSLPFEKQLITILGADEEPLPALRIMSVNLESDGRHHPAHKFRPSKDLHTVSPSEYESYFRRFMSDFLSKRISPYFTSEAAPDSQFEGPGWVKTVVGSTFENVVVKSDADVFIEFYAPWCGYCRKMEPAYKELARKLEDFPSIIMAKIDATRNEVDGVKVNGYPTLFLYPSGNKKTPIVYSGDRSTADMLKWLALRAKSVKFDPVEVMERVRNNDAGETGIQLEEL